MFHKIYISVFLICAVYCNGIPDVSAAENGLHFAESTRNFSLELLYHTAKLQPEELNMVMSPFNVFTVLAAICDGATGRTKFEITNTLRLSKDARRVVIKETNERLKEYTSAGNLVKFNGFIIDPQSLLLPDFRDDIKTYYETEMIDIDFTYSNNATNLLNTIISNYTNGQINNIVDSSYLRPKSLIIASGVFFKGQWTVPFNKTNTRKAPFYDRNGKIIGEVNMMFNRYTYPFANVKYLQARVIEIPYGKENQLSMLIMLPSPGVSPETVLENFQNFTIDTFFEVLKLSTEEYADDEVDCYIPRFKIESNIDLGDVLTKRLGVHDLFDLKEVRLPLVVRTLLYVSKVIHKVAIEVTEDGNTGAAKESSHRIGAVRFEANRPFAYMIIEKLTNTIIFGGFYKHPQLY